MGRQGHCALDQKPAHQGKGKAVMGDNGLSRALGNLVGRSSGICNAEVNLDNNISGESRLIF